MPRGYTHGLSFAKLDPESALRVAALLGKE